jgi:hypothetical protein
LEHKKIYLERERFEFDLFMILIWKHLLKQNKQMQSKMNATLKWTFYLFYKNKQLFFMY